MNPDQIEISDLYSMLKSIKKSLSNQTPQWQTVKEAAEYARISESKARKMIAAGDLPIHRLGGKILICRRELDYLIHFETSSPTKRQREKAEGLL